MTGDRGSERAWCHVEIVADDIVLGVLLGVPLDHLLIPGPVAVLIRLPCSFGAFATLGTRATRLHRFGNRMFGLRLHLIRC